MQLERDAPGLLNAILDSLSEYAVIVLDGRGMIRIWSAGARRMFLLTEREALGQPIDLIYTSRDRDDAVPQQERDRVLRKGRVSELHCLQRKNGATFWTEGMLTLVRSEDGEPVGYVKILRDATDRKRDQEHMRQLVRVDSLTGLSNRIALGERLQQMTGTAARHDLSVIVQMFDLDHFKNVNDELGHAAGDLLLQQVAKRITAIVRETDLVARPGGNEFVVLQPDVENPAAGARVAEQIVDSLSEPFQVLGSEVRIGVSIGISVYPRDTRDPDQLLRMADVALYKVKAESRGGYHYFSQSLDDRAHQRGREQRLLRRAVDDGALSLHYQPQIDVATGRVVAMEALLRCNAPELAHLSVDRILSLAVGSGLMREIGLWTVGEACTQTRRWKDTGIAPMRICLNLFSAELSDPNILGHVTDVLERTGLVPADLEIEVAEHQLIDESHGASSILGALRSLGVSVAIDDFGSGCSSLARLSSLPVDRIKLDRSFVERVPSDPPSCAIVRAIIELAHALDLEVVAVGVEAAEQVRFLEESNCELLQGYFYCPPVPAERMTRWLLARTPLTPH